MGKQIKTQAIIYMTWDKNDKNDYDTGRLV